MNPKIEYRVLWMEKLAHDYYPFTSSVSLTFGGCSNFVVILKNDSRYKNILIEAREASDEPWPDPRD